MQYLGSRVPLNIPHFRDFAATVKFYTHPNDVLGIFSCHNDNSNLCHFLGQAEWHVTGLVSQTKEDKWDWPFRIINIIVLEHTQNVIKCQVLLYFAKHYSIAKT